MNKLFSVRQIKKNVELYEDWDYFEDDELDSEMIYDENIKYNENIKNMNMHWNIKKNCNKEKCINNVNEINQLSEECNNLEKKCILIDYVKSEQLYEISDKITEICNSINKTIEAIELYEGDSLKNLKYDELTELEQNLIKLYSKVRERISEVFEFNI